MGEEMSTDLKRILSNPARPNPGAAIEAAAWAAVQRAIGNQKAADSIETADNVAKLISTAPVMRADAVPMTSTTPGGADEIVQTALGGYMASIAPLSAAARLIGLGAQVQLASYESISFPSSATVPSSAPWIEESTPIGVTSTVFDAVDLGPQKKMASITVVTRELAKKPSRRAIFNQLMRERMAVALDLAFFSTDAATSAGHQGLRYGLSPIASAGSIADDIAALLSEIATLGGSGQNVIIAATREAAQLQVKLPTLSTPVFPTRALSAGAIIALDVTAFVSAMSDIELFASEESVLHMSDAPLEIVSGTGPTTADPVRSMFQTACVAVRAIVDVSFAMRNDAIAVMENISW
jgi:hypothetical protein